MARHKAQGRYYLTADRSRVVAEGDPEAAFLYCTPGSDLDADEAKRLGLMDAEKSAGKGMKAAEPEPEPAGEPEAESKMIDSPPQHKAVPGPRAREPKD